jgi:hypothetical protein
MGGGDAAHGQGEATVCQEVVAGTLRGRGGAMGGDATTSRANMRVAQKDETRQPDGMSRGCSASRSHAITNWANGR